MHPQKFQLRIHEILRVRESYGMMPPVRAAVMADEDLRRIEVPTSYLLGDRDGATAQPAEAIRRTESLMPHLETVLVPGAGHDVVVARLSSSARKS